MATVTATPATTGQRVGKGFTDLAGTTDTLYKFGKVVSSGFHIVVEALKLVPGAEGISAGFHFVQGQVDSSLKVMGATHIIARFGEWGAKGDQIVKAWHHTANRVCLTFAQTIETVVFVDKMTVNFFDQPALKICNVSVLELAKNGFHFFASVFGLFKAGAELDAAYKAEEKARSKIENWTAPEETEAPVGEEEEDKVARELGNKNAREKFIEERKSALLDKMATSFAFFDARKEEEEKHAPKLQAAKQEMAAREQELNQAKSDLNARRAEQEGREVTLRSNQGISEAQQNIIEEQEDIIAEKQAIIDADDVEDEAVAAATLAQNEARRLIAAAQEVKTQAEEALAAATQETKEAEGSLRELENVFLRSEEAYKTAETKVKTLLKEARNYNYDDAIVKLTQQIADAKSALADDDAAAGVDKMDDAARKKGKDDLVEMQASLKELQKVAKKASNASRDIRYLQKDMKPVISKNARVNHVKTMSSYKVDKYEGCLQNSKEAQKKSWFSIAADIAKIVAIVLISTILIASFFFPVLTGPTAVLIVGSLSFIGYGIGLSKNLYNATAPDKIKKLTLKEYTEKKRAEEVAKAEKLVQAPYVPVVT